MVKYYKITKEGVIVLGVVYCPKCGLGINDKIYKECPVCNTKLPNLNEEIQISENKNTKKEERKRFYQSKGFWIKLIVCVILGFISVFIPISQDIIASSLMMAGVVQLIAYAFFPLIVIGLLIFVAIKIKK